MLIYDNGAVYKKIRGIFNYKSLLFISTALLSQAVLAVDLYGIFETQVTNTTTYDNPFNYKETELRGVFTAEESGAITEFFGFYDGDGAGGQTGNVWKIRFMPTEVGIYNYTLSFTDNFPIPEASATGTFVVTPSSLPGPIQIYSQDSRFLADASDTPIKWKAYSIAFTTAAYNLPTEAGYVEAVDFTIGQIDTKMIADGYNATMLTTQSQGWSSYLGVPNSGLHRDGDLTQFNIPIATAKDKLLTKLAASKIWTINWVAYTNQDGWRNNRLDRDYQIFLRYFVARYAAFYNYFGWSPTWETWELPNEVSVVNNIGLFVESISPWKKFPTTHDRAKPDWSSWQRIQLRQNQSNDIFDGNNRTKGNYSGYQHVIIGAEDSWEYCNGNFGQPRNGTQARRGLWGILFAGVYTMYNEWDHKKRTDFNPIEKDRDVRGPCAGTGKGAGAPFNKIAMDFWYDNTLWYRYQMLNNLVSSANRQIASGIPGQQYVVYDENGGSITLDLSSVASSITFNAMWFNPLTSEFQAIDSVNGGAQRTFVSPYSSSDSVLFLSTDPIPLLGNAVLPAAPTGVALTITVN